MFILDLVLMTLIPEMGNITDASMMNGPPPMIPTQSRLIQSEPDLRVPSRGSSNADDNGNDGGEKEKNLSPSQNSAITGMYVHV